MEATGEAGANVKPPPLNSDQLNYLIWRYLQESGYSEAAVKLQRDWKVDAEQLPFAKNIKGRALVSLVQKGLRFHHLSLTLDENGQPSKTISPALFFFGPDAASSPTPTSTRDLPVRPSSSQRASSPDTSVSSARKHARDNGPSEASEQLSLHAPKRSRKTANNVSNALQQPPSSVAGDVSTRMDIDQPPSLVNGHLTRAPTQAQAEGRSLESATADADTEEPSVGTAIGVNGGPNFDQGGVPVGGSGMEVDQPATASAITSSDARSGGHEPHPHPHPHPQSLPQQHAQPQPPDQEPVVEPLPVPVTEPPMPTPTLTNGESRGVQAVIDSKVADLAPNTKILGVPDGQHVTRALWRPYYSDTLTVFGTQFCGSWKASGRGARTGDSSPRYHSLIDQNDDVIVSVVAWEPSGSMLAVATYANNLGTLHIYDGQELALIETLPASQRVVTSLSWQAGGARLLAVAPYDTQQPRDTKATSIIQWDLSGTNSVAPNTASISVPEVIFDIECANRVFCLAGNGVVYEGRTHPNLQVEKRWASNPDHADTWAFVRCSEYTPTDPFVVAATADTSKLWLPGKDVLVREAHSAPITDLKLRHPQTTHDTTVASGIAGAAAHDFATCSIDGTVKIWRLDSHSNALNILYKLAMAHFSPVMALSYSPDGSYLAGASYDKVRIWSAAADHPGSQRQHQLLATWSGGGGGGGGGDDNDGNKAEWQWRGGSLRDDDGDTATNGNDSVNGDHECSGVSGGGSGRAASIDHSLAWDAESKKVTFGLGDQVAIIDFQQH